MKYDIYGTAQHDGCGQGKKKAFTLIELLVVIAIIALLAAILFPVFARARENARKTACASNMKQIALGFAQYLSDYDSRYPYAWDTSEPGKPSASYNFPFSSLVSPTNDPVVWPAKIEPYLKNRQIFTCPSRPMFANTSPCYTAAANYLPHMRMKWEGSDPVVGPQPGGGLLSMAYEGASMISYGYNVMYLSGNQYPGRSSVGIGGDQKLPSAANCLNCQPALESEIQSPASTVLIVDNGWADVNRPPPAFATVYILADSAGDVGCNANGSHDADDTFDPRHLDGMNVAFADGHVKWMKKPNLLYFPSGNNDSGYQHWNSTDPKYLWNRF